MLNKVAFGGIYYIHYPKNAKQKDIEADNTKLNNFVKAHKLENFAMIGVCTDNRTLCISSKFSNPDIDIALLSQVNPQLAKKYIAKTKVDLFI